MPAGLSDRAEKWLSGTLKAKHCRCGPCVAHESIPALWRLCVAGRFSDWAFGYERRVRAALSDRLTSAVRTSGGVSSCPKGGLNHSRDQQSPPFVSTLHVSSCSRSSGSILSSIFIMSYALHFWNPDGWYVFMQGEIRNVLWKKAPLQPKMLLGFILFMYSFDWDCTHYLLNCSNSLNTKKYIYLFKLMSLFCQLSLLILSLLQLFVLFAYIL